ncbi:hypothetical protein QFC21_003187 [Naganishia friedmannii]|uniref:Uncharacterized protein n=1 Tax=Naganishia friedmannii TaxID=89922 RepID=A0ACC2VSH9_9TREE|nr:hypothetical protein QFC21_003187 [Naganishia friedmannii]
MGAAIAALFAACEGPVIDKTLATRAIRDGFSNMAPKPWNSKRCLLDNQSRLPGELLAPSDLTLAFRNTLGLKGLAAYTHTFARLPQVAPDWEALALSTTGQRARR